MKKWLYLIGLMLVSGTYLLASPPMLLFFSGNRTEIHPMVIHDQIFLPLSEVASLFHLKANVDLQEHQISLEPLAASEENALTSESLMRESVISGEVRLSSTPNLKIKIFRTNAPLSDNEIHADIESWILHGSSTYLDTHGLVTETEADPAGQFAFSKIPPGNYELFGLRSATPKKLEYWWLPLKISPKETLRLILDEKNLTQRNF